MQALFDWNTARTCKTSFAVGSLTECIVSDASVRTDYGNQNRRTATVLKWNGARNAAHVAGFEWRERDG